MPVKWTPDKDQWILSQILTKSHVNTTALIGDLITAWPETDFGDKPTKKAFTEHFGKIRNNIKSGTATALPATPATARATPRTNKSTGNKSTKKGKGKTKKTTLSDSENENEEVGNELDEFKIKKEVLEDDHETPAKKRKRSVGVGKYAESDEEGILHPSEDEWVEAGAEHDLAV